MILTNEATAGYLTIDLRRTRIDPALAAGCRNCGGERATLVRRKIGEIGVIWAIHLQCDGCGRSLVGALPREGCSGWQALPEWNAELADQWWEDQQNQREGERLERQAEYAEWLATSPEWAVMRRRVLNRARGLCEGCLNAPATEVHHSTYLLGRLPPAWTLHAVCRECHARLHEGWQS